MIKMGDSEDARISWLAALCKAISDGDIDHFPRALKNNSTCVIETSEVISRINAALNTVDHEVDEKVLDRIIKFTRESLDEVKALTEYQDGKATRLLTLLTFFGALAGIVFGKISESFPFRSMITRLDPMPWSDIFVWLSYAFFASFAALALCGVLVTFHAIRARFKYTAKGNDNHPRSYLFYSQMIVGSPERWVESFTEKTKDGEASLKNLYWAYVKNYILESYLVASKAADKLRFLSAAQSMQAWSIKMLMLFFLTAALAAAFTKPFEQTDPMAPLASAIQELATSVRYAEEVNAPADQQSVDSPEETEQDGDAP